MKKVNLSIIIIVSLMLLTGSAESSVILTGKITAVKDGRARVEFSARNETIPAVGDTVAFTRMITGIPVDAGKGQVTAVETDAVWVKMIQKEARLNLDAAIHATGKMDYYTILIELLDKIILDKPDKTDALKALTGYHNNGNADATAVLAQIYTWGYSGITVDLEKAWRLARQSVKANSLMGHLVMGNLYDKGKGTEKNYKKAVEHYQIAADGGLPDGCTALGIKYHNGHGVSNNYKKAFGLFQKAAAKKSWRGLFYLGYYYEKGLYVTKDLKKAKHCYLESHAVAPTRFSKAGLKRLGVTVPE